MPLSGCVFGCSESLVMYTYSRAFQAQFSTLALDSKHKPNDVLCCAYPTAVVVGPRRLFRSVGRHLSVYYVKKTEMPKRRRDGYENVPTLVGMADVFINHLGYVWNTKAWSKSPLWFWASSLRTLSVVEHILSVLASGILTERQTKHSHNKRGRS